MTQPHRISGFDITLKYVSISVGAIAGVLAVVLAAVCHKQFIRICLQHWKSENGRPSNDPGPENYEYDVFMIFNCDDYTWVEERLLLLLERQHQLRCRIHHRDFRAGGMIYDLMSDSVYRSYKNIVVYSWNFLNSRFCGYELNLAKQRLLSRNDDSLVIIRIDDADLGLLPEDLQTRSVIDYGSDRERTHWKRKLLEFLGIPHRYSHLRSTENNDTEVSVLEPVNEVVIEN
ncbi:toll-like receptor 2 [Stylophora pistillata]|uniref:toll-like receptor 2 n=1 Tax=Stylophora pistillata TaxID=50429 RepID=UPI000C04C408|nr:toll-like receptor 2 [Stylophora pistillata]